MTRKIDLRKEFLALRDNITRSRKEEASLHIIDCLKNRGRILTFYSIGSEIDLSALNALLVRERKLLCNRIEEGMLVPYLLENEAGLSVSRLGIPEPNPSFSKKALFSEIDCILVPGLCFDRSGHRLGYGKGYYDTFLTAVGNIPTIGVGFREQLSATPLPRDPWDIAVKELLLV